MGRPLCNPQRYLLTSTIKKAEEQIYGNEKYVLHSKNYSLKQGWNKFGEEAKAATRKEMKQLHDKSVFSPIILSALN